MVGFKSVVFDLNSRFSFSYGLSFSPFLQGVSFAEVIQMTDIFEGSIIRLARRLDEFLNQVSGSESVEILILAISEKMLKTNYSMLMFSWVFSLGYVNSYSFLSATFLWFTSFCIFSEVEKFYFFSANVI